MTFDTTEASVQDSQPREYCQITHGTTTYRIAFADRDMVVGGFVYTAIASARSAQVPAGVSKAAEMSITLPIDHAFCKRYTQQGIPPKVVTATVWRQQSDGTTDQLWNGNITAMAVDDECTEATFRIRSRAAESLLRVIPVVVASRSCPLIHYGTRCGVSRTGTGPTGLPHKVTTTVLYVNGRDIRVDLSTIPAADPLRAGWAENGEVKHVASGEIMTVITQADVSPGVSTVTLLTMQAQIIGLAVGDSVEVQAGCARDIVTCSAKFANKQRYGGFPQLPTQNPFTPQSWGVFKS